MLIDHLTLAGPTLAALLQSALAANRPCEGLLFGSISTTRTTQAHDSSEALVVEETAARLTASIACARSRSFFSNSGAIRDAALRQLLKDAGGEIGGSSDSSGVQQQQQQQQQRQLLGWFSYRPDTPGTPSMREAAVSLHLQQWLQANGADRSSSSSEPALLFGLITSQTDYNNATLSLQYRFFSHHSSVQAHSRNSSGAAAAAAAASNSGGTSSGGSSSRRLAEQQQQQHPNLVPLDVRVQNLGQAGLAAGQHHHHHGPTSSSRGGLQDLPALAAVCGSSGLLGGGLSEQLVAASSTAAAAQLSAVQGLYDCLLDELRLAAGQAADRSVQLEQLRARNAALRQQVTAQQGEAGSGSATAAAATTTAPVVDLLL